MAESAEHSMQRRIEEFEEIQRVGLLDEKEICDLKKKCRNFEYKLRAVTRDLNCYLNYINYEDSLLKLICSRRDKYKIGEKKGSIEYSIIKRIKKLYEEALRFSPNNYDLCIKYFLFCKRVRYVEPATAAVDRLLKLHANREETWNLAASWYAKGQKNYKYALEIILKGLVLHPTSSLLYTRAIKLQLVDAQFNIRKCEKETPNKQESMKNMYIEKINYFIEMSFTNIKEFTSYFDLLELLDKYDFIKQEKQKFIEKLTAKFAQEPLIWHNLAQRSLKGLDEERPMTINVEKRRKSCIAKYLEGLDMVPQNKRSQLWTYFIDYLTTSLTNKQVDDWSLNEYLLKAHNSRCLEEKYYYFWLELNKSFAGEILKKATEAYPRSQKWHEMYLKYKISKQAPSEEIAMIFHRGKEALGDEAINLWAIFIQHHITISSDDTVQNYFISGIQESSKISLFLRSQYLKWLRDRKSIEEIRSAYANLSDMQPFCKELHLVMLDVESDNIDNIEAIYNTLCKQFPEDLDIWLNFMEFYVRCRKGDLSGRNRIYQKALCMLPKQLQNIFKEKCSHYILLSSFV